MVRAMPKLEAYFHYRNLDVSTLKELARRWKPEIMAGMKKHGKHEALADIYEKGKRFDEVAKALDAAMQAYADAALAVLPTSRALESKTGIRIISAHVEGDGGIVDVRYQVLDPNKAKFDIITHARSKPFFTQVFTNGLLITEDAGDRRRVPEDQRGGLRQHTCRQSVPLRRLHGR